MKELFKSYIPDSITEIKRVWDDALIVFDANTILNLYRYSDKSRSEFIALLKSLKQRIWTPEQAAHEYFKNRPVVIGDQTKAYEIAGKSINELRNALRKDRGHPFIEDKTMNRLSEILEKVEGELEQNKEKQASRISSDDIMSEIVEIFDGRVGRKISNEELDEIFAEGAERYAQKTPPGYKDASKHNNPTTPSEKRSVFGDLIVWKQTIAKAKELKKPVIFVTDDAKDDWWLEEQGKTIGPRIELLDEFNEHVGQNLYMYRPEQFLKHAKEKLHSEISRETIDEIRATDESRVSEKERNILSHQKNALWILQHERNRRAHIADGVNPEPDTYQNNALARRSRNGLKIKHNQSLADLASYQSDHELVKNNISNLLQEKQYIDDLLNESRFNEDGDMSEVDFLIANREELETILQSQMRKLSELRARIELEATLRTTRAPENKE